MNLNKRGQHVGVILSFVIFVTFLIFLYSILQPSIRIQKDKQALLEYLEVELLRKFVVNLTTASVIIDKSSQKKCIELEDFLTEAELSQPRIIVKNDAKEIFPSYIIEGDADDLKIERSSTDYNFLRIYYSEEFDELTTNPGLTDCKLLKKEKDYKITLLRLDKYIFETKIIDLIDEYENNYENLKSELRIPIGSEFGFSFTYSDRTIIGTSEKNISTNIYVEEIPIQYIDKDATLSSGFINVKVW